MQGKRMTLALCIQRPTLPLETGWREPLNAQLLDRFGSLNTGCSFKPSAPLHGGVGGEGVVWGEVAGTPQLPMLGCKELMLDSWVSLIGKGQIECFVCFPTSYPQIEPSLLDSETTTDVIASHIIIISKQAKDYANHSIPCTPEGGSTPPGEWDCQH